EDHYSPLGIRIRARMHFGAVRAALRCASTGDPGSNTRNLWHARQVEHRVVERVVLWQIDDRVIRRREHFSNLGLPDLPGVRAPEISDPEEAPLQQVRPEPGRILAAEEQSPHFLHDDDRALKQLVVGQAHDEMSRLSVGIEADSYF